LIRKESDVLERRQRKVLRILKDSVFDEVKQLDKGKTKHGS